MVVLNIIFITVRYTLVSMSTGWLTSRVRESKTVVDWIPGTRFWILCQWNLDPCSSKYCYGDSGFCELYSTFQSPGFRISQQKFGGHQTPQAKISQTAVSGWGKTGHVICTDQCNTSSLQTFCRTGLFKLPLTFNRPI